MKVESVDIVKAEYVVIDGKEYRRTSAEGWEELMGDSWEPMYFCEEHEMAYQEWKREHRVASVPE